MKEMAQKHGITHTLTSCDKDIKLQNKINLHTFGQHQHQLARWAKGMFVLATKDILFYAIFY